MSSLWWNLQKLCRGGLEMFILCGGSFILQRQLLFWVSLKDLLIFYLLFWLFGWVWFLFRLIFFSVYFLCRAKRIISSKPMFFFLPGLLFQWLFGRQPKKMFALLRRLSQVLFFICLYYLRHDLLSSRGKLYSVLSFYLFPFAALRKLYYYFLMC